MLPARTNVEIVLKKISYLTPFIVIIILNGFRDNVGTDYPVYINIFYQIKHNIPSLMEYGFYWINKLFINKQDGYRYVLLVSSLISYFFMFKVIIREKIFVYGVFFIFTFGFVFTSNNIVRQSIVIPFFYWSVIYIEQKKILKYLSCILLAFLFHRSALFLIPFYWVDKIKLSNLKWIALLCLSTLISFSNLIPTIITKIVILLPKYQAYALSEYSSGIKSGATNIIYALVYLILLHYKYLFENRREKIFLNIFLVGINISFVCMTVDFMYRISFYFIFSLIIVIPILIKKLENRNNKIIITIFFIIISLLFWYKTMLLNDHGCIPYNSFLF
jgi:hypothetical protein